MQTMENFRGLGHRAVSLVEESIEDLMGAFRPTLDLGRLKDRISKQKRGHRFLQDARNGLDSAYLEFSEAICTEVAHGLKTRNGWNGRAVRRYLKKEEKLLEYIMLMML